MRRETYTETTDLGVEKAQELVPVDTGTARSSIIGYLDEAEGVGIISAGGYCKYIEFGTGVRVGTVPTQAKSTRQ